MQEFNLNNRVSTNRSGGKLEAVFTGLQQVTNAKAKAGSTLPLVHFRFLAMKHNEHEIGSLREIAKSKGADILSIKTLNPYDQGECHSSEADGLSYIPENPKYQRFEHDLSGKRIRLDKNPCKRLWNCPVLHWDGHLSPCDMDPHGTFQFGHVGTDRFKKIWQSTSILELRRQFRDDYQSMQLCRNCSNAFKGGMIGTDSIVEVEFLHKSGKASLMQNDDFR